MTKKSGKKIAAADADQYMLRLPPGLRDRVARRAAENGRSMNTEIIDAIEKHLEGADRITHLWYLFEKNRENLEAIPHIWAAVEDLEHEKERETGRSGSLTNWRHEQEKAARPPITADQVAAIGDRVKELGMDRKLDFSTLLGLLQQVLEESQRKKPPA
jgi:hypothetical protein